MPKKNKDANDESSNMIEQLQVAYEESRLQLKEQSDVIGEAFILIYKAGLIDELSPKTRQYISDSLWLQKIIRDEDGPSLEPRLSVGEYVKHMARILEVPPSQLDFLTFIVKTCYIMILTEKNPMVAQELRGVSNLTNVLSSITRR